MSYKNLKNKIVYFEVIQSIIIFVITTSSFVIGRYFYAQSIFWSLISGLVFGTLISGLIFVRDRIIKKQANYIKGLKGEEYLEKILKQLPQNDYKICKPKHARYGNIDFLVVSKNGIFCIEEKNIGGRITYDEKNQILLRNGCKFDHDYLKQTKRNAREVNQYVKEELKLDKFVKAVLVFSDPGVIIDIKNEIELIKILSASQLLNYLSQSSVTAIDYQTVEAIANLYK